MLTPKYIAVVFSWLASIPTLFLIPGIDTILVVSLIFIVVFISLIVNLFFFWDGIRKILYKDLRLDLLRTFYLDLYHNDEFVDFLIEKRNNKNKKAKD